MEEFYSADPTYEQSPRDATGNVGGTIIPVNCLRDFSVDGTVLRGSFGVRYLTCRCSNCIGNVPKDTRILLVACDIVSPLASVDNGNRLSGESTGPVQRVVQVDSERNPEPES